MGAHKLHSSICKHVAGGSNHLKNMSNTGDRAAMVESGDDVSSEGAGDACGSVSDNSADCDGGIMSAGDVSNSGGDCNGSAMSAGCVDCDGACEGSSVRGTWTPTTSAWRATPERGCIF